MLASTSAVGVSALYSSIFGGQVPSYARSNRPYRVGRRLAQRPGHRLGRPLRDAELGVPAVRHHVLGGGHRHPVQLLGRLLQPQHLVQVEGVRGGLVPVRHDPAVGQLGVDVDQALRPDGGVPVRAGVTVSRRTVSRRRRRGGCRSRRDRAGRPVVGSGAARTGGRVGDPHRQRDGAAAADRPEGAVVVIVVVRGHVAAGEGERERGERAELHGGRPEPAAGALVHGIVVADRRHRRRPAPGS